MSGERETDRVRPLTEGYVVKGGRNHGPSQIKERPAPPGAITPRRKPARTTVYAEFVDDKVFRTARRQRERRAGHHEGAEAAGDGESMNALTIWKTVLKPLDVQQIEVPAGAELMFAREQHEEICVWYRCDPQAKREQRQIAVVGTGHPAPGPEGRYLGTAALQGGRFMFHVFEKLQ